MGTSTKCPWVKMIDAYVDIKELIMFESHPKLAQRSVINVSVLNLEFLILDMTIKFKWSLSIRKLDYNSFYNNTGGAIYRVRLMDSTRHSTLCRGLPMQTNDIKIILIDQNIFRKLLLNFTTIVIIFSFTTETSWRSQILWAV